MIVSKNNKSASTTKQLVSTSDCIDTKITMSFFLFFMIHVEELAGKKREHNVETM